MSCPHSLHGTPDRCSQCIADAPVKRVTQQDDQLLVDGIAARPVDPPADPCLQQPRGQRRRRGRK